MALLSHILYSDLRTRVRVCIIAECKSAKQVWTMPSKRAKSCDGQSLSFAMPITKTTQSFWRNGLAIIHPIICVLGLPIQTAYVVVATEGAAIIGVGAITSSGEITLNYVSPDTRFRGVSKAILNQLEARALELGHNTCTLTSTETARRFYLSAGYVQFGPPEPSIGKGSSYRMVKQLFLTAQAV